MSEPVTRYQICFKSFIHSSWHGGTSFDNATAAMEEVDRLRKLEYKRFVNYKIIKVIQEDLDY